MTRGCFQLKPKLHIESFDINQGITYEGGHKFRSYCVPRSIVNVLADP